MENWLDKYKPEKLSQVVGSKTHIAFISNFIKQFAKNNINIDKIPNANLIISGKNGVGKTLITDLVLKEHGFEKVVANLSGISVAKKSKKKAGTVEKEISGTNRSYKTYYKSIMKNKKLSSNGEYVGSKMALVIDNVTSITNSKEKDVIKAIVKLNNKLKLFPIIIIAGVKHNKTVNELRKMVMYVRRSVNEQGKKENRKITNEIVLKAPEFTDMEIFIKDICIKEKLKILPKKTDENDIYVEIVEHSQYDMRRLLNILEELKSLHNDTAVTYKDFAKYCETSKKKDLDPGIYEATKTLLNSYEDIDTAILLYCEERATIPLMVHENYPLNIRTQYPKMPVEKQIDMVFNISKSISESDKIDGLIYSNQCWSLQPVHGFYSCVLPSYYINQPPGKIRLKEDYKYTQDYNKTSIKKINNKVIKNAQSHQCLKKASIYDFLYMASILRTQMEKKDFEKVADLMMPYGLPLKQIESIIKIDKIKATKIILTSKQQVLLRKLLGLPEEPTKKSTVSATKKGKAGAKGKAGTKAKAGANNTNSNYVEKSGESNKTNKSTKSSKSAKNTKSSKSKEESTDETTDDSTIESSDE